MAERPLGTVLVTGGASGLGAAIARRWPRRAAGRWCWTGWRRRRRSRRWPRTRGGRPGRRAGGRGGRAGGRRAGRRPGRRVHPAGTDRCGTLAEVDGADWDRVVLVNLLGTAAVVRAALPYLTASHGTVVTCASTLGFRALSDATAYCASKFGVVGFTRALAAELQGSVGVTMLVPGGMRTAFFDDRDRAVQAAGRTRSSTTRRTWPRRCCSRCASRPAARCASWWSRRRWRARGP